MIRYLAGLAILLTAAPLLADEPAKQSPDEAAIRKAIESYVAAFNRGDADAVAKHFSETGTYVDPVTGEREVGREAIAKALTERFAAGAKSKLVVDVQSVRLLDDQVALEEGTATVVSRTDAPEVTTYIAVHVKKDGKWFLDSVRETALVEPEEDRSNPLDELDWMIGRWIDAAEESTVETVCSWALNDSFMTRSFTVAIEGRPIMSGTQIIAWDAAQKRIRSWIFDTDGSFGEGTWTHEDDRWVIRTTNTLADGRKGTGLQIITKVDNDHFTFQSIGRQVDGEILPDIEPITIVRKTND